MTTRVLRPEEVVAYRAIRLEALRTDPRAFCSTHEREAAFDDDELAERLISYGGRPGAVIVDGEPDATAMVGIGEMESGDAAMLWGMWVRPSERRTGAAGRLVTAAVEWASTHGHGAVDLWVVVGNTAAIAFYERHGFAATGSADVVPGRPGVAEVEMRRRLT